MSYKTLNQCVILNIITMKQERYYNKKKMYIIIVIFQSIYLQILVNIIFGFNISNIGKYKIQLYIPYYNESTQSFNDICMYVHQVLYS